MSGFFFSTGDIYEEAAHHNAVFVGRDEDGAPRYAHQRGTAGSFRLDVKGSDKAFNFCYRGEGERLFVFEAPIDLLSFLCLFKKDWQKQSYLSLGGVGEKALLRFLSDRPGDVYKRQVLSCSQGSCSMRSKSRLPVRRNSCARRLRSSRAHSAARFALRYLQYRFC